MGVTILGVDIDAITMSEAVGKLDGYISQGAAPMFVATANAEMVMGALKDPQLAIALAKAAMVVPDGAGVVWAARYLGQPVPERVAGYDLAQQMLAKAAEQGYRTYFLGGAPGAAEIASKVAQKWYPGLEVVGFCDGYFSSDEEPEVIESINAAATQLLLVALGVPKQEKWLANHLPELNVPVSMGVGGTFDVMSGTVRRAPLWMQQAGLEWLFRLVCQPSRFIRMLALPAFVLKVTSIKKH